MQRYWQWKQVRETKCRSSQSFNIVFLHVTLVLQYGKKTFSAFTEQSDAKHWLTKYLWLFQSIGGLQQLFCWCFKNKCCKNMSSIILLLQEGMSKVKYYTYHGNHVFCVMAAITFLVFQFVPPCIGLRWCPDAVIVFLIY